MSQKNQLRKLRHKFERVQKAAWQAERDAAIDKADQLYRSRIERWHGLMGEQVEWEDDDLEDQA